MVLRHCSLECVQKFQSCYNKCAKLCVGYKRHDSVTGMLFDTGLPSVYVLSYIMLVMSSLSNGSPVLIF